MDEKVKEAYDFWAEYIKHPKATNYLFTDRIAVKRKELKSLKDMVKQVQSEIKGCQLAHKEFREWRKNKSLKN